RGAVSDGKNMEHRYAMSLASVMAGICIRHAIAGAAHAMAHSAGGLFHVPHGTGCGMFLADVMEFNLEFAPEKFARVAEAMGLDVSGLSDEEAGRKAIEEVRKIYDDVGLPKTLGEFGVKADDVERLADTALGDGCVFMNPRPLEPDDFKELFGKFV
ncbi:MAG: iron-containing alcohol dehydrogenase, partial [bacterium]